jgi:hypothetical protein
MGTTNPSRIINPSFKFRDSPTDVNVYKHGKTDPSEFREIDLSNGDLPTQYAFYPHISRVTLRQRYSSDDTLVAGKDNGPGTFQDMIYISDDRPGFRF